MTETIPACSDTVVRWLGENGYIAYPKDVFIKGRLSDNFPIEIQLKSGVRVAILCFNEGCYTLEGWLDNEHSQELAEKISFAFNINVEMR